MESIQDLNPGTFFLLKNILNTNIQSAQTQYSCWCTNNLAFAGFQEHRPIFSLTQKKVACFIMTTNTAAHRTEYMVLSLGTRA